MLNLHLTKNQYGCVYSSISFICPTDFQIPDYNIKIKITIPNNNILISIPLPFIFLFFPSFSISLYFILSSFRPHSVFLPAPFSPSLSFPYIHSTCAQLSLLITHSAPSFLFFHPIPVFSLLVPTFKSRHHFSFFCIFPPIFAVVSGFFDSFPSVLLVCVFIPFTQLYIHASSFCS
jgi:hypothetical protein